MAKNFTIKSIEQDFSGRHTIVARAADGDVFTLNTAEREDFDVNHVIEVELDNMSSYPATAGAPEKPKEVEKAKGAEAKIAK